MRHVPMRHEVGDRVTTRHGSGVVVDISAPSGGPYGGSRRPVAGRTRLRVALDGGGERWVEVREVFGT